MRRLYAMLAALAITLGVFATSASATDNVLNRHFDSFSVSFTFDANSDWSGVDKNTVRAAVDNWESAGILDISEVSGRSGADIVIAHRHPNQAEKDGGCNSPGCFIIYDTDGDGRGVDSGGHIDQAVILFNKRHHFNGQCGGYSADTAWVAGHEMGHAVALKHTPDRSALMYRSQDKMGDFGYSFDECYNGEPQAHDIESGEQAKAEHQHGSGPCFIETNAGHSIVTAIGDIPDVC